jgi:hypothetical protein
VRDQTVAGSDKQRIERKRLEHERQRAAQRAKFEEQMRQLEEKQQAEELSLLGGTASAPSSPKAGAKSMPVSRRPSGSAGMGGAFGMEKLSISRDEEDVDAEGAQSKSSSRVHLADCRLGQVLAAQRRRPFPGTAQEGARQQWSGKYLRRCLAPLISPRPCPLPLLPLISHLCHKLRIAPSAPVLSKRASRRPSGLSSPVLLTWLPRSRRQSVPMLVPVPCRSVTLRRPPLCTPVHLAAPSTPSHPSAWPTVSLPFLLCPPRAFPERPTV